jgi:electron-transferring-flavoprotein dehydrogenase
MASKTRSLSLVKKTIHPDCSVTKCVGARRTLFASQNKSRTLPEQRTRQIACERRAYTTVSKRRFATGSEQFDPRQEDRESDQVDVCIVGGGML